MSFIKRGVNDSETRFNNTLVESLSTLTDSRYYTCNYSQHLNIMDTDLKPYNYCNHHTNINSNQDFKLKKYCCS